MQKFVKVSGYDNWFMLLECPEDVHIDLPSMMQNRLKSTVSGDLFKSVNGESNRLMASLSVICHNAPDYAGMIAEYGPILVREVGSWMTLGDRDIVEMMIGLDFPSADVDVDIVVCENDSVAPAAWMDYLAERFPGRSIYVISYFRTRSDEYLLDVLKRVNVVTFCTTFTSFNWFEKLVRCLPERKVLMVGRSSDIESWSFARNILGDKAELEIV